MRAILKPNGEKYCGIEVQDGQLLIHLRDGLVVRLDAKIIPQLRQILTEAEFLKYI